MEAGLNDPETADILDLPFSIVGTIRSIGMIRRPWSCRLQPKLERRTVRCTFEDVHLEAVIAALHSQAFVDVEGHPTFGEHPLIPASMTITHCSEPLIFDPEALLAFAGSAHRQTTEGKLNGC